MARSPTRPRLAAVAEHSMKPVVSGFFAAFALLALYALTMTALTRSWDATVEQFIALWWFMVPLAVGFGIQVGLYVRLKEAMNQKTRASLAAGGTSAGVGMLACCAHHATDVLPILGLSAAATLIARYQIPLLSISLLVNIVGISIMWKHLKKAV